MHLSPFLGLSSRKKNLGQENYINTVPAEKQLKLRGERALLLSVSFTLGHSLVILWLRFLGLSNDLTRHRQL
jgi:hypothetical protein